MKVKSKREVAQSCPTLSDTMDYIHMQLILFKSIAGLVHVGKSELTVPVLPPSLLILFPVVAIRQSPEVFEHYGLL